MWKIKFKTLIRSSKYKILQAGIVASGITACAPINLDSLSSATACLSSGDIVVSNSGTDAVLVLNSDGSYKRTALELTSASENIYGVHYDRISNRLLVVIDGTDRILSLSAADCTATEFTTDTNIAGNMRGITRLASGDVLVVETAIERLNVLSNGAGSRTTVGAWPKTLQTAGSGIGARAAGGFVHCSTTTDVVRTYDDNGTQINTVSSGIAGTTDAMDCRELTSGNIVAVWSGTTDTVSIYNSTLASTVATYSNLSLLSTPGGVAQRGNGNVLILDRVLNHIVEITENGSFVQTIGGAFLNTPEYIEVVP